MSFLQGQGVNRGGVKMSRNLHHSTVTSIANTHLAKLNGSYNAEDIRTIMHDIGTALVQMSTADLDTIAVQVVEQDYKATLDEFPGAFLPISALHTIANIKRVRELTGVGLKEARDAVRGAVARVYRNLADNALRHLAMANTDVQSYPDRAYVSAVEHHYVLRDLHTAANDNVPF